jgi:hypothetical protein
MPVLESLRAAVQSHTGQFTCSEIHNEKNTKTVHFRHVGEPPEPSLTVPDVRGVRDFYSTYSQLTMYLHQESGEAAYLIARPSQWQELDGEFRPWLDGIDEDEIDDYLPSWIEGCIVVGEIPRSGNHLLLPAAGPEEGKVFEFDHDGFEFIERGLSLEDFIVRTLDLDASRLTAIASHVRFITTSDPRQWWIEKMQDSRGNVIRTEA